MSTSHWIYNNTIINEVPESVKGFVYRVKDDTTGMMYIGKKSFYSTITKPPLKGYKRKRKVTTESKWRTYTSSSKIVNALIKEKGIENFTFEILVMCPDKAQLNYAELVYQIKLDVLQAIDENGDRTYLNENIALRYYPSTKPETIEFRRVINESFDITQAPL